MVNKNYPTTSKSQKEILQYLVYNIKWLFNTHDKVIVL